jgi:hypothetical protein
LLLPVTLSSGVKDRQGKPGVLPIDMPLESLHQRPYFLTAGIP